MDMRNTKLLEPFLRSIEHFSDAVPTLLISEVVLTYMAVNSCNALLRWISELFVNCMLVAYEQINPHDGFGQVMCAHFAKLGSPLKCILKYPNEQEQIERYTKEVITTNSLIYYLFMGYSFGCCFIVGKRVFKAAWP